MSKNKTIKVFTSCIPVKGANRSIICDLQRTNFKLIPNDLFEIIELCNGKTLIEIKSIYKNKFDAIIEEYFEFLFANEYVFFTDNPELFPQMSMDWFEPFGINNAIIDYEDNFKFESLLFQLDFLKCKSIEIRFFNSTKLQLIEQILIYLNELNSISFYVGFLFPYSEETQINKLKSLILNFPRVSYFVITNSNENNFIEPLRQNMGYIYYTKEEILSSSHCGKINSKDWSINTRLFTESQHHNTCLNRKISIDKDGNIKNCPSMPQSFGNIKDTTLEEALNHPDFKKYWNVNKDMIAVCKDCEFRHICTDCRAYTERTHFDGEIDLSKPLKCGYNPYTNEWAEWSTNPLKEKAIEYYGLQDLVKKDA